MILSDIVIEQKLNYHRIRKMVMPKKRYYRVDCIFFKDSYSLSAKRLILTLKNNINLLQTSGFVTVNEACL
jgi:hypothetical protein